MWAGTLWLQALNSHSSNYLMSALIYANLSDCEIPWWCILCWHLELLNFWNCKSWIDAPLAIIVYWNASNLTRTHHQQAMIMARLTLFDNTVAAQHVCKCFCWQKGNYFICMQFMAFYYVLDVWHLIASLSIKCVAQKLVFARAFYGFCWCLSVLIQTLYHIWLLCNYMFQ